MSDDYQWVQFQVAGPVFNVLVKQAAEHGFTTIPAFLRWVAERQAGTGSTTSVSEDSRPLLALNERLLLEQLIQRPNSVPEIARLTRKHYQNMAPIAKKLRSAGWILECESKFTGGRPASMFEITEAGRLRLEQEKERRSRLAVRAAELEAAQRMASARAFPDVFKIKRNLKVDSEKVATDPYFAFTQAALDALYDWCDKNGKKLNDDAVLKRVQDHQGLIFVQGGDDFDWVPETAKLKAEGWPENAGLSNDKGEEIEVTS